MEAYRVETSRLPHFLDIRLTDGGEVVSLMRQPPFTPQEDCDAGSLVKFCYFGRMYCLHVLGGRVSQANELEASSILLGLLSETHSGGSTVLPNFSKFIPGYTVSHLRM
jgi:hypothetical protein